MRRWYQLMERRPSEGNDEEYFEFDFTYYDEARDLWIHANHEHDPDHEGSMVVLESTTEYFFDHLTTLIKRFMLLQFHIEKQEIIILEIK